MAGKEPFYFKSFDRVIGVAHDEVELLAEIERLSGVDPAALEYHLSQGHIASWLSYIGRDDLASLLTPGLSVGEAMETLRDSLAGHSDQLTCPHCGFVGQVRDYRLSRAPWRFGNYVVRVLTCPRCGRRFRLYYPLRAGLRPFTVPKGAGQGNS